MADNDVRYSWQLLRAGEFRLDGGSMFGPRGRASCGAAASRPMSGAASACSTTACSSAAWAAGTAPRTVLIETGSGDKLDPKSKEIFALEDRSILSALAEVKCDPGEIEAVFVSHLHFDHAGGLTRQLRAGEEPDWVGPGSAGESRVKRTFPNAKVYVQQREWHDALANRSVMTRTYFRDHIEPLQPQVVLMDSPRPFPSGYQPDRDEKPASPALLPNHSSDSRSRRLSSPWGIPGANRR